MSNKKTKHIGEQELLIPQDSNDGSQDSANQTPDNSNQSDNPIKPEETQKGLNGSKKK